MTNDSLIEKLEAAKAKLEKRPDLAATHSIKSALIAYDDAISIVRQHQVEQPHDVVIALQQLIGLKKHKDRVGKTSWYEREQPKAWDYAKAVIQALGDASTRKDEDSSQTHEDAVTTSSANPSGYTGDCSLCEICGKNPIMHRGSKNQCCGCHVGSGAAPADWHPECMKAYNGKSSGNSVALRGTRNVIRPKIVIGLFAIVMKRQ